MQTKIAARKKDIKTASSRRRKSRWSGWLAVSCCSSTRRSPSAYTSCLEPPLASWCTSAAARSSKVSIRGRGRCPGRGVGWPGATSPAAPQAGPSPTAPAPPPAPPCSVSPPGCRGTESRCGRGGAGRSGDPGPSSHHVHTTCSAIQAVCCQPLQSAHVVC